LINGLLLKHPDAYSGQGQIQQYLYKKEKSYNMRKMNTQCIRER